mmetsp:Transcript_98672/g.211450  ORF Transcript_98672/g.211450 Transcript_98672/m.211450 type:complete len:226 (-) Transcript_98672:586-1263(-)
MPAHRCSTDQSEGTLVGDTIMRDVDTVHGEGLWLCVEVLNERVHDRVIQHIAIGLHDDTRHTMVPEDPEKLIQAIGANGVVGQIHVRAALLHIGEVLHHQWHLRIQPIAKLQQLRILHWRFPTLQLDMDLALADNNHLLIPGGLVVEVCHLLNLSLHLIVGELRHGLLNLRRWRPNLLHLDNIELRLRVHIDNARHGRRRRRLPRHHRRRSRPWHPLQLRLRLRL